MKLAIASVCAIPLILIASVSAFSQTKPAQKYQSTSASEYLQNKKYPTTVSMCKVCAEWGKGQPGTFAGPCIRYVYQPCSPAPGPR